MILAMGWPTACAYMVASLSGAAVLVAWAKWGAP